ncbi:MAG: diguanylate cyclase [Ramlibacter sp.]|nr:diguanylate cyclase [Ramlibacter sp.]
MDTISAFFWGGYFATAAIMLAGIAHVLGQGLYRVPVNASISLSICTLFVVAYLGWLPLDDPGLQARVQAQVGILTATLLAYMLLDLFGYLRYHRLVRRAILGLAGVALVAVWLLPAVQALRAGAVVSGLLALFALGFCLRGALYGERMTWAAAGAVLSMLVTMVGLNAIVLAAAPVPWPVHAVSAVAAIVYLVIVAAALAGRYAYLIEVRRVLSQGPSYDPVTRMPSHTEALRLAEVAFYRHEGEHIQVGVLAVTIGNLYVLEQLHGRAAVNHAMFVCAGRLRRSALRQVAMGRLDDDGFLLLLGNLRDPERLVRVARAVVTRLSRPVVLSTQRDEGKIESGQTQWVADVGVGMIAVQDARIAAESALARARAMSRAALSFPGRVAFYDTLSGQIAELPRVAR